MADEKFAIVKLNGTQVRVTAGATVKIGCELGKVGESLSISEVLCIGEGENVNLGAPLIKGATVSAKVLSSGRSKKVVVFKKKNKGYTKTQGHRQSYTTLQVESINA